MLIFRFNGRNEKAQSADFASIFVGRQIGERNQTGQKRANAIKIDKLNCFLVCSFLIFDGGGVSNEQDW